MPHPVRAVVAARIEVHDASAVKYHGLAEHEPSNDWRAVWEAKAHLHRSVADEYRELLGFFEGEEK